MDLMVPILISVLVAMSFVWIANIQFELVLLIGMMLIVESVFDLRRRLCSVVSGHPVPYCLPRLPVLGSLPFIAANVDQLPRRFMEISKRRNCGVYAFYAGSR